MTWKPLPARMMPLNGQLTLEPWQPFFFSQVLLVGLGGDPRDDAADLELGGPEQGSVVGIDEGARDLEQFLLGSLSDGLGKCLGLGFLCGGEGCLQGHTSEAVGGFLGGTSSFGLVYKNSAKFRDAHTPEGARRDFA